MQQQNKNAARIYKQNAIKTASPARLTLMLYDAAVRFCDTAIETMENDPKNVQKINDYIKKAEDAIMELRMGLDMTYPVAQEFEKVYDYIYRRLVEGNMQKDVEIIKEALKHTKSMRDTWKEVMRLNNAK
ncbi:flagellar export chaperone FliS [Eubacterium sp. MSJ-13]|uniref:flagellar export chaperone FliS n=1 Tax=Eubacterium sp. MSJ-13 TaxID=2841513 RepID=UPI001C126921|nr:flagellar export chaperone FliS [Eubacterium sp. MSJ-13]MBU5477768.1 flagellar export chaperone FliS [Eubacterium sp. MSJ-13]